MILQFRPGARFPMQFELSEKLALHVMLLILTVVPPTFETVTVCGVLSVPTSWFPNVSELLLRLSPETTCVTGAEVLPVKLESPT